jgi:ribosomal protein L11 methylase PrmA
MTMTDTRVSGSFRDPSGFLFRHEGVLYRRVNSVYASHYDALLASGLCEALQKKGMLIAHQEVNPGDVGEADAYRVIQPPPIPYITYPYEWCFSQLKEAALLTLSIQKRALKKGMTLKDASAYNVQFCGTTPVMIDTLSFEIYEEGAPWIAYRQFCQHFLAPLALMAFCDVRMNQALRIYLDGIPLEIAVSLLPFRVRLHPGLMIHLCLHAKSIQQLSANKPGQNRRKMSKTAMLGLVDSLETAVRRLTFEPSGTEWADYYEQTNYSTEAFDQKKKTIADWIEESQVASVWDLGANDGTFSRLAADRGIPTLSFDIDPAAVEKNYRACREREDQNILPLVMDLTNPSPGIGWANTERDAWHARGRAEMLLALALIHHLAIGNNVPLVEVARLFASLSPRLVIEFVPKSDSQVQRMLSSRKDIFVDYDHEGFEQAFGKFYDVRDTHDIEGSDRRLYFMEAKSQRI